MSDSEPSLYRFGVYELDPGTGELRREGRLVRLQPQPFTVLLRLLKAGGAVVSREELQQELWGGETFVDFEQGLNTCVRQIRLALGDSADSPRFVQTLQRRGYRFLAPVEAVRPPAVDVVMVPAPAAATAGSAAPPLREAPDETTDPAPPPPARTAAHRPAPAFRLRSRAMATAAVLLLLLLGAGGLVLSRSSLGSPDPAAPEGIRSLAVLPLADLSPGGDQEYLADGLTEALIADLARIKALRVISRTSAMHYKNTSKRISEIARELNVEAVVEGSVVVSGSRIRVTTQLVDARDDAPLWSATYDRELEDVLTLQHDLARTVASEIRVRVTPPEEERLAARRTVNPDAYRQYLLGRYLWNRRTTDSLRAALEHFERAVALDPGYAAAHTAIAQTYMLLGDDEFPGIEPVDALAATRRAARRALALDPDDAGAWAALATVEYNTAWNWSDAQRYFERALLLAPGDANVHHWYGWFLISQGRMDEAQSAMAVAQDLNPLSPIILTDAAYPHLFAGRADEAIRRFRSALAQDQHFVQAHVGIGRAHDLKGDLDAARQAFERAVVLSERAAVPLTCLARVRALAGDEGGARALLKELTDRSRREYIPPLVHAWVHIALGERDAALGWLERAVAARSATAPFFLVIPELQGLAGDPRFEAIVARLQTERLLPPAPPDTSD